MEQNNTYKYLSVVLAIIAVAFAILYFTKSNQPVTNSIGDATDGIEECRNSIATWRLENSNQSTSTADSRAELQGILEDCEDILTNANTL